MFWFTKKENKEDVRYAKIADSQAALLKATSIAADTAQAVTNKLLQRLEESQRQFKSIFEQSFDGIIVIQNSHIVSANPSASVILGLDLKSILSTKSTVIFSNQTWIDDCRDTLLITVGHTDGSQIRLSIRSTKIIWNDASARLVTFNRIVAP